MKKVIAITLLISVVIGINIPTANALEEWPFKHRLTPSNVKLNHAPFWMLDLEKTKKDDIQVDDGVYIDDDNLFSENTEEDNIQVDNNNNDTTDSDQDKFLNDLFGNDFIGDDQSSTDGVNENGNEENSENIYEQNDSNTLDNSSDGLEDIDSLFGDIFGKYVEQEQGYTINNKKINIKKRKLRIKIAQKKKRILIRNLTGIQAL